MPSVSLPSPVWRAMAGMAPEKTPTTAPNAAKTSMIAARGVDKKPGSDMIVPYGRIGRGAMRGDLRDDEDAETIVRRGAGADRDG